MSSPRDTPTTPASAAKAAKAETPVKAWKTAKTAKTAKPVKQTPLRQTLHLLRPHLGGSHKLMLLGLLAIFAEVAARLLEPWPVQWVIDGVIPYITGSTATVPDSGGAAGAAADAAAAEGEMSLIALLITAGVAVVLIGALRAGASYLSTVAFANVGARVTQKLRGDVHRRLLDARRPFHQSVRSGDLVTRVVSDVAKVQEAAVTAGLPLVGNLLTVVGMLVVVVLLDPILALSVLVVLPLMALSGRTSSSKITDASRLQRRREGELAGDAGEAFGAVHTVQTYRMTDHLVGRFAAANMKGLKDGVKAKRLSAGLERRTDLFVALATGVVLTVGGWRVVEGAISPGELTVFLTYLKTTFKPLRNMAKHTGRIARAAASGERIAQTLEQAEPETDTSWARPLPPLPAGAHGGRIDVEGITVSYTGATTPVLRGADLTVRAGESVALVGPSGAGKSTLMNVLLRFLEPHTGSVRLDGHLLRDITRASLRDNAAVVLQDSVIFAGTLAENVRIGRADATDREVEAALRDAQLGSLIDAHPDGIDQPVAERGSTLSGGQRQRLAVARALLRDPRIVLLDEPTTGLDEDSAREVLTALRRLAQGRTVLLVTHDPALLADVDRVVELRDRRFVDITPRGGDSVPATPAMTTEES